MTGLGVAAMFSSRRQGVLFAGFFGFCLMLGARAEAGVDLSGCQHPQSGREIEARFAVDFPGAAEARRTGPNDYVIFVNEEAFYLGWETLRWLFMRECGRIHLGQRLPLANISRDAPRPWRANTREAADADCWAVHRLMDTDRFGGREIEFVERDIQRFSPEQWDQVMGPRRSVNLFQCMKR